MKRPRGLRQRLLLTVVLAVAGALAIVIASFNIVLWDRLSAAADNGAYARADAELAALAYVHGHLVETHLADRVPLSGEAWVFAGRTLIEQPRVGGALDRAAQQFAQQSGRRVFKSLPGLDARLYLTPILLERQHSGVRIRQHLAHRARAHIADRRAGVVVVAISMRPFEATRNLAMLGSIVLALALLAIVAAITRWTLGAALRPVATMTAAADSWDANGRPARLSRGKPYDEITRLALTLDRLLDRISASLRRERRFSAELSHELRTPLTRLTAEIELALRHRRTSKEYRATLESLLEDTHYLTRTVDTLVLAAQHETTMTRGRADALEVATNAVDACSGLAGERGLAMVVQPPPAGCWLGVERDVAARIVQPVVQNARRYARSGVSLHFSAEDGVVALEVTDDGPGVPPNEAQAIFQPGFRGSAAEALAHDTPGAGLGLSLARRLAEASGSVVDVVPGPVGRFVVRFPSC